MVMQSTPLGSRDYVCVLKAKQAETDAVEHVDRRNFVPLFRVPDAKSAAIVAKSWGAGPDVVWIHPRSTGTAVSPGVVRDIFDQVRLRHVTAVPVLDLPEDPAVASVIAEAASCGGRGVVLRIDCLESAALPETDLAGRVASVLDAAGQAPSNCDLVLDAGTAEGAAGEQAGVVEDVARRLHPLADWRSVVVAFSAFPAKLSSRVPRESRKNIERTDAEAFSVCRSRFGDQPITFADFGVGHPGGQTKGFRSVPNLRYARERDWAVWRAEGLEEPGRQFAYLARALVEQPFYRGEDFSAGDRYWMSVARGDDGPGNPLCHLRAAMSHHFATVLDSLAARGEP